jgi:hypothetical protein
MTASAFGPMTDALVAATRRAVAPLNPTRTTGPITVLDGPAVDYVGTAGVAIGATREDIAAEWSNAPGDLAGGSRLTMPITCLAWSGSGSTPFAPHRATVVAVLNAIEAELAADRSLAGAVSAAWITSGTWTQEQTGAGALVTCEFRVTCQRF